MAPTGLRAIAIPIHRAAQLSLVRHHKDVEPDSMKFARAMLESVGVAVVPGAGFGSDGYFRFSFATDIDTIKKGIDRIKSFVESYKS